MPPQSTPKLPLTGVLHRATALFTFPYPDGSAPSSIQVFDFGCPVVDFVVVEDGHVWTLLDGEWTGSWSDTDARKPMTRIVKFSEGKVCDTIITLLHGSILFVIACG